LNSTALAFFKEKSKLHKLGKKCRRYVVHDVMLEKMQKMILQKNWRWLP